MKESTFISLRYLVIATIFAERKSFKEVMCTSFPKKMLFARFCTILAIFIKPRRMTGSVGTGTSTKPGCTIAGEINLRIF